MMRMSAGIMSPAASFTMSPGTSDEMPISCSVPSSLLAVHVLVTIFCSASLDTLALYSCQKRRMVLSITIEAMIIIDVKSFSSGAAIYTSIIYEMIISAVSTPMKGFIKAFISIVSGCIFFSCSTSFLP